MNYIDLFSGAGGLSEGFNRAGFECVGHIEMDKDACNTLTTRICYNYFKKTNKFHLVISHYKGELTFDELASNLPQALRNIVIEKEISDTTLSDICIRINENLKNINESTIDVIVGGPPCQTFSLIRRHNVSWETDKRTRLYKYYGKLLHKYNPKLFVFENVPGIISAASGKFYNDIKTLFSSYGYNIEPQTVNSKNVGVLQNRKRIFILGYRKGLNVKLPEFVNTDPSSSVKDILIDLPKLKAGQSVNYGVYASTPSEYLLQSKIYNELGFFTQHVTRPHNQRDMQIYKLAILLWNNDKSRIKYYNLPPKLQTHKNINAFTDRFKVVDSNGLSHTVVAHISKDGHYYIHPDLNQCRSISIREAARIQTFPDDYFFEGSRTSIFRQIGNAVPPLLAEKIAINLKTQLEAI